MAADPGPPLHSQQRIRGLRHYPWMQWKRLHDENDRLGLFIFELIWDSIYLPWTQGSNPERAELLIASPPMGPAPVSIDVRQDGWLDFQRGFDSMMLERGSGDEHGNPLSRGRVVEEIFWVSPENQHRRWHGDDVDLYCLTCDGLEGDCDCEGGFVEVSPGIIDEQYVLLHDLWMDDPLYRERFARMFAIPHKDASAAPLEVYRRILKALNEMMGETSASVRSGETVSRQGTSAGELTQRVLRVMMTHPGVTLRELVEITERRRYSACLLNQRW